MNVSLLASPTVSKDTALYLILSNIRDRLTVLETPNPDPEINDPEIDQIVNELITLTRSQADVVQ